jgi:hypothetical protein
MVLEGNCPKCGYHTVGWALKYPQHKTCPKCGVGLKIIKDGHGIIRSESLYRVKEHIIDVLNTPIPPSHGKKKENSQDSK